MMRHTLLSLLVLTVMIVLSSFAYAIAEPVVVYKFDNTAGQLENEINNATNASTSFAVVSQSGIGLDGGAWEFAGGGSNIQINGSTFEGMVEGAMIFKVKLDTVATDDTVFGGLVGGASNFFFMAEPDDSPSIRVGTEIGNAEVHTTDSSIVWTTGDWITVGWTYSEDRVYTWVNDSIITSGTHVDGSGTLKASGSLTIGNAFSLDKAIDGLIDEILIFNVNLTQADLTFWHNNFFSAAVAGAPDPPVYVNPTPADNAANNTNQTLNVTHSGSDIRYYLNVSISGGNTDMPYIFNETETGIGYKTFLTNFSDGVFTYEFFVQNISNGLFSTSVSRNLTIDTVTPTITLNPNNAFNASNQSFQNQYQDFMFLNVSFNDETGLFGILINVTRNDVSFFNHTNTSLANALSHNFSSNISTSTWEDGVYDIELTVADGSTVFSIEDYGISGFLSRITFNTKEENKVDIIGSGAISTNYNKKIDRYEFGFNYLTKESTRKFTVKCDNELFYMNNPNKIGHFVCWNGATRSGNWIDFEGIGNNYSVEKIKDNQYDITFINLPLSNKITVKSIGGLNVRTENYQWFKGSAVHTFLDPTTSGTETSFTLNTSWDQDLIKNITASFRYNGTLRTVTREEQATNIVFDSTFSVPLIEDIFNVSWEVNITQRQEGQYSFFVNSTQQTVQSQVNLSIFDEENQSFILEDLDVFFSGPTNLQTNTSSGKLSVGNLEIGDYFIAAEGSNYPRKGVFFTVSNASANLNLFLVRDVTGNEFVDYFIQDSSLNRIDNARMTFQRVINGSLVTVAQLDTDFAGQARIFQDQQSEYTIIISNTDFPIKTLDLIPIRNSYTITLDSVPTPLFENTFEGVRYVITPAARVLNVTNIIQNISFAVFDSANSLEFFGMEIVDTNFTCVPASCISNISGSAAGGQARVGLLLNSTGSFAAHFFFKRNGFDLQFVNKRRWGVDVISAFVGKELAVSFFNLGQELGTPAMRSVFAAILITTLCALAAQMGVLGLGLVFVSALGNLFFMLVGFIDVFLGLIIMIFALSVYFVLGRDE